MCSKERLPSYAINRFSQCVQSSARFFYRGKGRGPVGGSRIFLPGCHERNSAKECLHEDGDNVKFRPEN